MYRGLGGVLLPKRFYKLDTTGATGGVELGFLSTTTDRDVAIFYTVGSEVPTVCF